MIAEDIGIDMDNVQYDAYGEPFVVLDEGLINEAVYVSDLNEDSYSTPSTTPKSDYNSFDPDKDNHQLEQAKFGEDDKTDDAAATAGYIIYKLSSKSTAHYQWVLNDSLPNITLSSGSEVYVGIILDQLYDQHATAKVEVDNKSAYDTEVAEAAKIANGTEGDLKYTHVKSPSTTGNGFNPNNTLYKITGSTVTFAPGEWSNVTYGSQVVGNYMNNNCNVKVIATAAKKVIFTKWSSSGLEDSEGNNEPYTDSGYLSLGGTGSNSNCAIVLNVNEGDIIKVTARSSGSATRPLVFEETVGTTTTTTKKTVAASGDPATVVTYEATQSGPVYIYSGNSGIKVYKISVAAGTTSTTSTTTTGE
jgi:hypothetical protein